MRYCSEDAPRTGERNVNFNKTTSENTVLNKTILVVGGLYPRIAFTIHSLKAIFLVSLMILLLSYTN